jgi:ribose transport system ATP-binding protein
MTDQTTALLAARSVDKAFGPHRVLKGVSIEIEPGRVHALVGENGAGKSTLIKILTGSYDYDGGAVEFDGAERRFSHPRDALALGIGVVPQERQIIPELSAAENVLLGHQPKKGLFVDHRRGTEEAAAWLGRVGLDIDPGVKASTLSVAEQQLLEIARGLSLNSRVLFLDEPTASLTERETEVLLGVLRGLRAEGVAMVYVSHKLSEVYSIADSVTVLRDGSVTLSSRDLASIPRSQLVTAMVGRDVSGADDRPAEPLPADAAVRLSLDAVATSYGHADITFDVRAGEILGLYGIVGAGRSELAHALIGRARVTGGRVEVDGRPLRAKSPADALRRYRLGYVSEDRKGEGLVLDYSVRENVSLTILDRISVARTQIRRPLEATAVRDAVGRVGLDPRRVPSRAGDLSGGNQQKVSVAKWIAAGVGVLIVDEPTVGVDVSAKEEIYQVLRDLAAGGAAVLLISSELEEVVRLSDRVGVMVDGRLRSVMPNTHSYQDMSGAIMDEITRLPAPAP